MLLEDKHAFNATLGIIIILRINSAILYALQVITIYYYNINLFRGTLPETIDEINYCVKCRDYIPNCLECISIE